MKLRDVKRVGLGTGSALKIAALQEALPEGATVVPNPDAESGVRPQPVGREETEHGAVNRAAATKTALPDLDAWVGIENGVWLAGAAAPEGCAREDAACIAVLFADGTELRVWSDALPIPDRGLPFKGGPNGEWSELKDPHAVLTSGARPRQAFLRDAIVAALDVESTAP